MQVESALMPPPFGFGYESSGPAFEDFFNMEMLASSGSQSSGSSPRSPEAYPSMPLTPPPADNVPLFHDASSSDPSFFNLYTLDEDFAGKTDVMQSNAPYDFLGAFNALSSMSQSSPEGSLSPESVAPQFAIDPQLVGTPSTSAMSEFGDEDEEAVVPEEAERQEEAVVVVEEEPALVVVPVKVGGHGKARKGTVQSGGVTKKAAPAATKEKETTSVSIAKKDKVPASVADDEDLEDNWRPSPEEYKKMSSKEKRQLRNKISARNFRVRRKEYISTLEGDIAERDQLLDAIRSELGSSRSENSALRQEIDALKKALLAGRPSDGPVLPPPGPLPLRNPSKATSSANLLTANTQKDLPSSPRVGARAFWGGFGGVGAGGITHVHTTIIPDLGLKTPVPALQENLNPALNARPASTPSPFVAKPQGFDSFTETNPFTLRSMDAYRMQLWGKMAAQHQFQQEQQRAQQPPQYQQQPQPQLSGLASNLRPHYFTSPKNTTATLSGKVVASAYPIPPNSPPMLSKNAGPKPLLATPQQQADAMAALASQTLVSRLGSAFWDAFSGSSSSASGSQWDADKVRKVLEGKAVVRVVDIEAAPIARPSMGMRTPSTLSSRTAPSPSAVPRPLPPSEKKTPVGCCMSELLAESMGSLTIAAKKV